MFNFWRRRPKPDIPAGPLADWLRFDPSGPLKWVPTVASSQVREEDEQMAADLTRALGLTPVITKDYVPLTSQAKLTLESSRIWSSSKSTERKVGEMSKNEQRIETWGVAADKGAEAILAYLTNPKRGPAEYQTAKIGGKAGDIWTKACANESRRRFLALAEARQGGGESLRLVG